jgi:site-specific recombinase XerD
MQDRTLERFIHYLRGEQIAETTVRVYASYVSMYLQALAINAVAPSDSTRDSIARYFAFLKSRGNAAATIEGVQTALRRFHAWLAESGLAGTSPLSKRIRIQRGRKLPRAISQEAAATLIESVAGADSLSLRDRAMLELLYSSGLRAGEVLGMRTGSLTPRGDGVRIVGKGSREAVVNFGDGAAERLRIYLDRARAELLGRERHEAFWVNCFGGPLKYAGLHRMLNERSKAAGLPPVHPHMLRHSFATHLMERGAHLRVIQELMRHASVRSTEVYTHLDTSRLAEERRRYHPRG